MSRDFDPPTHPVLRALHERIHELFPFGLGNIWMSLSGDTYNHMATTLGYSISDLDNMISATPLINGRGVMYNDFEKHLRVKCDNRDFFSHNDGITRREKWVRFVPSNEYSSNDTYMPYSESAELFTKAYFKTLREFNMQTCHRLTSSLKAYIQKNSKINKSIAKGTYGERDIEAVQEEEEEECNGEEDGNNTMEVESPTESAGSKAFFLLDPKEQEEIVLEYLRLNSKRRIFEVHNKNNTKCMWVRFPCHRTSSSSGSTQTEAADNWRHFNNHVMPKSLLQQILGGITVSLTVGVYCLTRALSWQLRNRFV